MNKEKREFITVFLTVVGFLLSAIFVLAGLLTLSFIMSGLDFPLTYGHIFCIAYVPFAFILLVVLLFKESHRSKAMIE